MKRMSLGIVLSAAAFLCFSGTAAAQGAGGVHFGISGGGDFPVSDQKDVYKTGWNGTALLAINFGTAPVGIRIDGSYHELRTADEVDAFFNDANTRIISGTVDLLVGPRNLLVEPYFVGGVGVYDLRFKGQEITSGNAFSDSTTRFGYNLGGGLSFPLGRGTRTRIFVEARYTSISLNGDRFRDSINRGGNRFTMVPVNVGFMF